MNIKTHIVNLMALVIIAFIFSIALIGKSEAKTFIIIGQSNAYQMANEWDIIKPDDTIINCGHNGQKIVTLLPNYDEKTFYGSCLKNAWMRPIDVIIFWQGESDARNINDAKAWSGNATTVIRSLRQDLNANIPVIMMILNNLPHDKTLLTGWWIIREAQKQFNAPFLKKIDSSGYEFEIGNIHLTPYGYDTLINDISALKL